MVVPLLARFDVESIRSNDVGFGMEGIYYQLL